MEPPSHQGAKIDIGLVSLRLGGSVSRRVSPEVGGLEPVALDDQASVPREREEHDDIVVGEGVAAVAVGDVEATAHLALGPDRDAEHRLHRRMLRRKAERLLVGVEVVDPDGAAIPAAVNEFAPGTASEVWCRDFVWCVAVTHTLPDSASGSGHIEAILFNDARPATRGSTVLAGDWTFELFGADVQDGRFNAWTRSGIRSFC